MTITMPSLTSHRRKASEAANATSSSRPPSHPMAKMAPIENDELTAVRAQSKHFAADLAAFATHMARISPRIPCSDLLLAPHYVDVKLGDVRRQVEGLRSRRAALRAALARSPAHARLEADQAAVARELDDKARELVVLTRQTKAVQQDLADEVRAARERGVDTRKDKEPPRSIDDAYLAVLAPKMLVPARVARGCARGVGLKALVFARYDALRSDCGGAHAHCCLLGLTTFAAVKPTYIVPPALQGEPLAHLLGVKEAVLTEPRNMLPLDRTVAKALREGLIVFAPAGPFEQTRVAWKCVVVDKSRANELGKNGRRWRDLNGAILTFQNEYRPASRFLFFRFVMAYLEGCRSGDLDWLKDVTVDGRIWACYGAWARRSMLQSLARRFADVDLPKDKAFGHTMFDEGYKMSSKGLPQEEEDDLVTALIVRWNIERKAGQLRMDADDSDNDL